MKLVVFTTILWSGVVDSFDNDWVFVELYKENKVEYAQIPVLIFPCPVSEEQRFLIKKSEDIFQIECIESNATF